MKKDPRQQEWERLCRAERTFIRKGSHSEDTRLNRFLADKIPEQLQATLDLAFAKAFQLIFDKGTGIIEKTYSKEELQHRFAVNAYGARLSETKQSLRSFAKDAGTANRKNLLLSGAEGIGLGALGIGLPDIPLFVGVLLKSVYEVALHFGYTYDTPGEKYFILKLIEVSLSHGRDLREGNRSINTFIEEPFVPDPAELSAQIRRTAASMSQELLYMKFLQGIPVVGMIGGAYNTIYLQRTLKYAKLKYHQRMLIDTSSVIPPDDAC